MVIRIELQDGPVMEAQPKGDRIGFCTMLAMLHTKWVTGEKEGTIKGADGTPLVTWGHVED